MTTQRELSLSSAVPLCSAVSFCAFQLVPNFVPKSFPNQRKSLKKTHRHTELPAKNTEHLAATYSPHKLEETKTERRVDIVGAGGVDGVKG